MERAAYSGKRKWKVNNNFINKHTLIMWASHNRSWNATRVVSWPLLLVSNLMCQWLYSCGWLTVGDVTNTGMQWTARTWIARKAIILYLVIVNKQLLQSNSVVTPVLWAEMSVGGFIWKYDASAVYRSSDTNVLVENNVFQKTLFRVTF